jgi:hypothetical protein
VVHKSRIRLAAEGWSVLGYAYGIVAIAGLPLWLGERLRGLLGPSSILDAVCSLVVLVILFVVMPMLVSGRRLDKWPTRTQLASAIESQVDSLAAQVGLRWEGHYLSEVGDLLREGRTDQARKTYHDRAEVTWDQAYQALADWAATVIEKKLELLGEHLRRIRNQESAGSVLTAKGNTPDIWAEPGPAADRPCD